MERDALKRLREELDRTQEALAAEIGAAVSTVARWERGEAVPRSRNRRRYAEALDLTLAELDAILDSDAPPADVDVALNPSWTLDRLLEGDHAETDGGNDVASVVAQLEEAAMAPGGEGHRRPVLRLLGHAHEAAGEVAFDRLQFGQAADHYHQAYEIGVELGDPDLASIAVIQLGDIARRRRRQHAAVRRLESAGRDVAGAGLLSQVKRSQTLARTYAELWDRPAFEQTIGQAEHLAGRLSADHHRDGEHSPQGVLLEKAQGLTVLGRPWEALAIYEMAAPTSFRTVRERGSFLIIHAQALAGAGHLDEGVELAVEGLALARSYGSPRHVSRVQRMHDRLVAAWPRVEPRLAELREALAAS